MYYSCISFFQFEKVTWYSENLIRYLLLHVSISLLSSCGGSRAQDGNLIQLEELLTQAVLQMLVQLAAGTQNVRLLTCKYKYLHRKFGYLLKGYWFIISPTSCLQEVPEELLVAREGWRRAGSSDSMGLNEALFEPLQAPQTVGSQQA